MIYFTDPLLTGSLAGQVAAQVNGALPLHKLKHGNKACLHLVKQGGMRPHVHHLTSHSWEKGFSRMCSPFESDLWKYRDVQALWGI